MVLKIAVLNTYYSLFNISVNNVDAIPIRDHFFIIFTTEFISADEDISDQTICGSRNKRSISYLEVNSAELNWTAAWKHCNDKKSNLPLICNQHEQGALMTYLKKNIGSSEAWISGRKISFDEWKWIDGQPFDSRGRISAFVRFFSIGALRLINRLL